MVFRKHVCVATAIYVVAMAFFWFQSDATVKVKLIDAVPLTLGFLGPALLFIQGLTDYKSRFWKILAIVIAALFTYDVLMSLVVAKHVLFFLWYAMYPLGAVLLMFVLYIHAVLSNPREK